jgi:DNA-directed RNA polymerase subunit RPC12/RpoP
MPVKPNPYKLVCQKCGHSKIFAPKSDALSIEDIKAMTPVCSKCGSQIERKNLNTLDSVFSMFK